VGGFPRIVAVLALTVAHPYMNYRLQRFKHSGMGCYTPRGVFPASFCVNGTAGDPKTGAIKVVCGRFHQCGLGLYLNTLFWNLNYWDSISTLQERNTTLPKALFYALILDVSAYFFPLLICTGAVPLDQEMWSGGYFSDVAKILGGVWLRSWIQGASALSNTDMFVAEMSSDSFQLLEMAERGMLPEIFGKRTRYGTRLLGFYSLHLVCTSYTVLE